MTCDECKAPAIFLVFAAYDADDVDGPGAHPGLRRYPMPMIRACPEHLAARLVLDLSAPGSTAQWMVTRTYSEDLPAEHVHEFTVEVHP